MKYYKTNFGHLFTSINNPVNGKEITKAAYEKAAKAIIAENSKGDKEMTKAFQKRIVDLVKNS